MQRYPRSLIDSLLHRWPQRALLVAALGAAGCTSLAPEPASDAAFPIASVIAEVKRELAAAQAMPEAALGLQLQKVDLSFSLVRSVDASGKATIGVPVLEASGNAAGTTARQRQTTSTLSIELVPPAPWPLATRQAGAASLGLADAITEVRRQLAAGLNEAPALTPDKVEIVLKFSLKRSVGISGALSFLVVSATGSGSLGVAEVQTITLVFGPPARR